METAALSPLATLTAAFPQARQINGLESKNRREEALRQFNSDENKTANVLLVQKAIDKGWSGHDSTGAHRRVLINLGLPTAPVTAIQQEGRIYRVGQVSDASFRYFNTGTNWERAAFAQRIAERAATVENLGMGDLARNLKDSFIIAFQESGEFPPSAETHRFLGDQYSSPGGACTGAITTSSGWNLAKDGNVVTLNLPAVTGSASAAASFVFADVIPAKYRPSASKSFPCVIRNNGSDQATPGAIVIDYLTGSITVYRDGTQTANFTAGVSAGLTTGTGVSWTV
jgi:hypothetical protein